MVDDGNKMPLNGYGLNRENSAVYTLRLANETPGLVGKTDKPNG